MSQKPHWESIYSSRPAEAVGWYEPHLETSLSWIDELALPRQAPIIDVGGGASTLADDLLERAFEDVTVLDISRTALSVSGKYLGERASQVAWIEGDITKEDLSPNRFALWHDRAVFHFLITPEERNLYRQRLGNAVKPGGHLIIGVFASDGPPKCSGLPVERYTAEQLLKAVGHGWSMVRSQRELHLTPSGVKQMYLYCQMRQAA